MVGVGGSVATVGAPAAASVGEKEVEFGQRSHQ
jgi:hypothetical protein